MAPRTVYPRGAVDLISARRHGSSTAYIQDHCRCDECVFWNRKNTRDYRIANQERINARRRDLYAIDPDKYLRTMRKRREFLSRYKLLVGCKRCGFREHPFALTFHHLDPSQKTFPIGPGSTRSLTKIKEEIRKCEVLCANCHAITEAVIRGGDAQ